MAQAHADIHSGSHDQNVYFVPHGSRWPVIASVALFITMFGLASWLNDRPTSGGSSLEKLQLILRRVPEAIRSLAALTRPATVVAEAPPAPSPQAPTHDA